VLIPKHYFHFKHCNSNPRPFSSRSSARDNWARRYTLKARCFHNVCSETNKLMHLRVPSHNNPGRDLLRMLLLQLSHTYQPLQLYTTSGFYARDTSVNKVKLFTLQSTRETIMTLYHCIIDP